MHAISVILKKINRAICIDQLVSLQEDDIRNMTFILIIFKNKYTIFEKKKINHKLQNN